MWESILTSEHFSATISSTRTSSQDAIKKKWFPSPTTFFVQIQAIEFFKNDVLSVEIISYVKAIIFATLKYLKLFAFEIITRKMISNALGNCYFLRKENHFHLEMSFEKWLTSKKTSFLDFFGWRKWLRPVRNDLRKVWKWFSTEENDFKGTQKWLPPKWFLWDVAERIQDLIYSWEKKHFQGKLLFPEMDGNHFFHGNASQPPKFL